MNKIIGWIKGNLLIVISIVLIVLLLPAGWYFSNGWNKSVKQKATDAFSTEKRLLESKSRVTYQLPAVLEGEQAISDTRAPNPAVTAFFVEQKAERSKQVLEVVERGVALNKRDHTQLVDGLLPKAADERSLRRLGLEMAEQIAGTRDEPQLSVYSRLLRRLNADRPTDPETLNAALVEYKEREQERYEASNPDGKMTAAQDEQLKRGLIAKRLGEYKGRAEALTFYCTTDAIYTGQNEPFSEVPAAAPPPSMITEASAFNWLWDYWVISDVLEAVGSANTNAASGAMSIPSAPVKRVERVRVSKMPVAPAGNPDDQFGGGRQPSRNPMQGGGQGAEVLPSYTGHTGGVAGSSYDIRTVEMQIVASSKDLPKFFDALAKTNYMTVTDVDLYEVDVWGDLKQGYFYGPDHVVRAIVTIETVWLRSWTKDFMPDAVRTALGVPIERTDAADPDADADG
ncbi:MAG: hypothetical protein KC996_02280 [Phycisphaerales bacterium]|nr:hypothetical protein [Phycisphaerales bacterium]